MSGALPCTGSKTAYSQPMFAPGMSPKSADEARTQVGDDVAVEVGEQEHVEPTGLTDESGGQVVDLQVLQDDLAAIDRVLPRRPQEQAVRRRHDPGLVTEGDPVAAVRLRIFEREPHDPSRAGDRDGFHA